MKDLFNKRWLRFFSFVILGGLGGFAYYYFIGCRTGTCPLTSNPVVSTMFGGVFGLMIVDSIVDLFKPKKTEQEA